MLELLNFIEPSEEPSQLLLVEGIAYLPELRRRLPNATIAVVTEDAALMSDARCGGLSVSWTILDYTAEPLPFRRESFDVIVCEDLLSTCQNPQDIAAGFCTFIKPTGRLLTRFDNIRHWLVLEELRGGHYRGMVRRKFAREDFLTLMAASFYKDVQLRPVVAAAPERIRREFIAAGFADPDDLDVAAYCAQAWRAMADTRFLKSRYTPELRREMATLLRRIEFGVELPASVGALTALVDANGIDREYLDAFIATAVADKARFAANFAAPSPTATVKLEVHEIRLR